MPNMYPKEYSGFDNTAHASSANGQPIHTIIGTPEKSTTLSKYTINSLSNI